MHAGIQPSNDPSNLRVYGNLDKLLELNYHSNPHSERDDALVRMIGAKSLKQREKERNRLFYDATPFKEIINATVNSKANLDNFKYACLHEKAVLFENASIQVGVVSKVIVNENHYTASQAFVVNLHLINKKSTPVNITFTLPEIPSTIYYSIRRSSLHVTFVSYFSRKIQLDFLKSTTTKPIFLRMN